MVRMLGGQTTPVKGSDDAKRENCELLDKLPHAIFAVSVPAG
jgi:hypothetical protein